jgi:hypothetical protein
VGERDLLKISRESNNKTLSSSRSRNSKREKNCAERTFGLGYLSLSLVFVYASLAGFGLILYSKYVRMSLWRFGIFCVLAEKKLDESSSLCNNLGLHKIKQILFICFLEPSSTSSAHTTWNASVPIGTR